MYTSAIAFIQVEMDVPQLIRSMPLEVISIAE